MLAWLVDPLVDLVLPRRCVGCREPGSAWCPTCRAPLALCHATLTGAELPERPGLEVVAATGYAGPARQAMLAYKERGRRDLVAPLAHLLAAAIRAVLAVHGLRPAEAVLVCVPSTRAAAARRGGDHVARLAVRAARPAGVRVAPGVLRVRDGVRDSAGLSIGERANNLAGAMQARPCAWQRAPTRRLILVDDIVTSGATLLEARRALRTAGWPVVGAVAVAATPLTAGGAGVSWYQQVAGTGRS